MHPSMPKIPRCRPRLIGCQLYTISIGFCSGKQHTITINRSCVCSTPSGHSCEIIIVYVPHFIRSLHPRRVVSKSSCGHGNHGEVKRRPVFVAQTEQFTSTLVKNLTIEKDSAPFIVHEIESIEPDAQTGYQADHYQACCGENEEKFQPVHNPPIIRCVISELVEKVLLKRSTFRIGLSSALLTSRGLA